MADDDKTVVEELTPEQKAIEAAAVEVERAQGKADKLASARTAIAAADAALDQAKATHAAAVEAAQPKPEPDKHIFVDFTASGSFEQVDVPAGFLLDRRLLIRGVSVEHVDEDVNGCWRYRKM